MSKFKNGQELFAVSDNQVRKCYFIEDYQYPHYLWVSFDKFDKKFTGVASGFLPEYIFEDELKALKFLHSELEKLIFKLKAQSKLTLNKINNYHDEKI